MAFRVFEHTADLGIEATGDTAGEVLAEAALALTGILTGKDHPHRLGPPSREVRFAVEAPDRAALAVAFLSEVLWLFESQSLLWLGGGVEVESGLPAETVTAGAGRLAAEGMLRATARGNAVVHDPVRHGQGVEVKAVTYHGIEFRRDGPWRLRAILDI